MAASGTLLLARDRLMGLQANSPSPAENAAHARRLGEAQNIIIGFGDPSSFFVAPYLPEDARVRGVTMEAAQAAAIAPALDGIEVSLRQYPPGFLGKVIKAIFICGGMAIAGAPAGGTYGPAWVLLSAPLSIGPDAIHLTCRLGVHHEFSSFVYMRGDNAARWQQTEPPGWQFATTPQAQIDRDKATVPAPETGFLSAYGATTPENDFNVYAEKMMTEMHAVMDAARVHPIVARKAAFVRACYVAVDSRMAAVFDSLGMAEPAGPRDAVQK
jgi:hypothetical protein